MENKEPHTVNQHYVPKLLLKKFSSKESHVWIYDKEAKKKNWTYIKERPITKIASQDYFYDKEENVKEGSYEYKLRKIETEVAPLIEKIIENKSLSILSDSEKERISYFVVIQNFRTKYRQNEVIKLTTDINEKLNFLFKTNNELDSKSLWFSMLEDADLFVKYISNKVWFLGKSNQSFFSSDNPVVLQNITDINSLQGNLGFDSIGIEIYLPLNDSLILCMFCEKTLNQQKGLKEFLVDTPILDFDDQHVLNVNSLQFYQSERIVISSKNNFEMINKY